MNVLHKPVVQAATTILMLSLALNVNAEATETKTDAQPYEVFVTALKRESNVQNTAASITAIGEDNLSNANIIEANDLVKSVPSLVITDAGPGQRRFTLRGIRSPGESQVGVYYDETPVAGPPGTTSDPGGSQSDFKLFDQERIEVLRGPQGTLYGAGSVGGTIRLINQKPEFGYGGKISVTGTSTENGGNGYQLNTAVNLPLVDDQLATRIVYYQNNSDGWIDNPGLGLTSVNKEDTKGGRVLLRYLPTQTLTIDGAFHWQNTEGAASRWTPDAGKYNSVDKSQLPFEDKLRLYSLTAVNEFDTVTLTLNTAYQDRDLLVTRDPSYLFATFRNSTSTCSTRYSAGVCATPAGIATFNQYVDSLLPAIYYQPQSVTNWTSEIRLQSSTDSALQWTLGGYYEDRDAKVLSEAQRTSPIDGSLVPDTIPALQRHVVDYLKQKALFGEVSYELWDGLILTGGLRYYEYEKTVGGDTTIGLDVLRAAVTPFTLFNSSHSGELYKVNLSYQATDTLLLYTQAASGYRPGGVNQVIGLATSLPYSPDKLWTYEAGVKSSFWDRRLVLNLSAYRSEWDDMQVSLSGVGYTYLGNAGAAITEGVELETIVRPIDGLEISANVTRSNAELTEDQIQAGVNPTASTALAGDRIPFIPKKSASLAAQYQWNIGNWQALVRIDGSYVGESYSGFRPTNVGYRKMGDYTLVGARAGIQNDRWGIYLFANNLTNTIAKTSSGNVLGGSIETITSAPPRTVGINLNAKF